MNEAASAKAGGLESVSALGLLVGGIAGVGASVAALGFGLPLKEIIWWMWAIPLWAVIAIPLGWAIRQRRAAPMLRNCGRAWLLLGVGPLLLLLAFGKPVQKVMLEQQAADQAQ